MTIDCGLVCEHQFLLRPVRNRHDVHVGEFGTTLAPIRVRQNVVTPDLASCFDLSSFGNAPMKERVVARNASARCRRLYVLEKCREASNDAALIERARDT